MADQSLEGASKADWNAALEAAANVVERFPGKVLPVQDSYDGTVTQEYCEPSRHGFARAIRALKHSD